MKKILTFITCMICITTTSCSNKSEQDIENEISSGVVLVQNQSYYEVDLSNGEKIFFSNYDEQDGIKGIATEEDSVEVVTSFGTGFFVSEDGQIVTNAHVVSNTVADKDVNKSVSKIVDALKKITLSMYNDYTEKYQEAERAYNYANYSDEVSYEDFYKLRDIKDALEEKRKEYAETYNELDDIKASESEIKYHNKISIAYNDTYVTSTTDFVSCVITKIDSEHDLAILQLRTRRHLRENTYLLFQMKIH